MPEGGHLSSTQVQDATQIDEIFNALDEETRASFQRWQASAAVAIQDRGLDLNDAFGNLGPFLTDASDVLETLEPPEGRAQGPRPRHRHGLRRPDRSTTRSWPA